jgi:hypothetical protein
MAAKNWIVQIKRQVGLQLTDILSVFSEEIMDM